MALRPVTILLAISPLLALGACQTVGGSGTLSGAETQNASQVAFTAAAADRCAVPYNAKKMLNDLLARTAANDAGAQHHNDTLKVYNEVFVAMRRKFAVDKEFCSPERLAETRSDVSRYGG